MYTKQAATIISAIILKLRNQLLNKGRNGQLEGDEHKGVTHNVPESLLENGDPSSFVHENVSQLDDNDGCKVG